MNQPDINITNSNSDTAKYIFIGITVVAVLAGGYFLIGKPLLEALGLKESEEDKIANKMVTTAETSDYWNPLYYQSRQNLLQKNATDTTLIADYIYSGWGIFNDDETAIISNFRTIPTKADLSHVVYAYAKRGYGDLLSDIKSNLNSSEKIQVLTITENLK